MKKILTILIALIFAMSAPAFAAGVALTDAEMDGIAAGDWVVIDPNTQEVVEPVHYNNNDIDLEDQSQMEIQAVSNANAVDSAVAVQTNIASVTGNEAINNDVNGRNTANIINYNPSESKSSYENSFELKTETEESASAWGFDLYSNYNSSSGHNFTLDETLDIVETLNIAAAFAAAGEEECKTCESEYAMAAAFLLDYDYDLDYDKHITANSWKTSDHTKVIKAGGFETEKKTEFKLEKTSSGSEYRKNLSENNHIDLSDDSQRLIQAVSNLNAVGSGAAVQTNIASNVGVSGTITHVNTATVINGL